MSTQPIVRYRRGDPHPVTPGLFFWTYTGRKKNPIRWVTGAELERHRARNLERGAKWRAAHPEKVRAKMLGNVARIKAMAAEERRAYYDRYRQQSKAHNAERLKFDPKFRMIRMMRKRLGAAFNYHSIEKRNTTIVLVGCTPDELKHRLELLFLPGMSWDNYGRGRDKWHIDHRIPLAWASNEEELIGLCHYTNLQPLWEPDNARKGARLPTAA